MTDGGECRMLNSIVTDIESTGKYFASDSCGSKHDAGNYFRVMANSVPFPIDEVWFELHIVACRSTARQRPRNKQLYYSCY
jgi:hypothetical protein